MPQVARGPRILLLRKEGAPGDTPPPAQHGDGDGACSPRSKRAPSSALRPAVSGRVPESEVRRAPRLRTRTRIRTPDPRRRPRAGSPDPGPARSRARPEPLPAPGAIGGRRPETKRAAVRPRTWASGGSGGAMAAAGRAPSSAAARGRAVLLARRRARRRAPSRRRGQSPPPRPAAGHLASAPSPAGAGRARPRRVPPVRLRAPPRAPGTSPEGPPRGGLTRGPLLREFTRRKSGAEGGCSPDPCKTGCSFIHSLIHSFVHSFRAVITVLLGTRASLPACSLHS